MAGPVRAALVAAALALLLTAAPAGAATNNIFTAVGDAGAGFSGDGGPAASARVNTPTAVEMMPDGGYLIADQFNKRVRRVAPDGTITTVASASFSSAINGLAILPDGSILVADSNGNVVRKIKDGTVSTVAGTGGSGFGGDGGPATAAQLSFPTGVAALPDGGFLIADQDNNRVRRVGADGKITTVAGNGFGNGSGDGGPATDAQIGGPTDIALTSDGGFLVTEFDGNRVRKVSSVSPGATISRVAGASNGAAGGAGDGGAATSAQLSEPTGIAVRPAGGFIVAERSGNRVRAVGPDGVITTVAGTGTAGYSGDNGLATNAKLNNPTGVAVDTEGDYLIADALNSRIRRVDAGDPPPPPGPPPPPPDPTPPHEHTLLGQVTYEPPYGIGFKGLDVLGPFDVRKPPSSVTVTLRDASGAEVAHQSLARLGGGLARVGGAALYRLDDLGPCEGCTLELTGDGVVQDSLPVSFGGEAGQTGADLIYGRKTEGGVVTGTVQVPFGARARDLNVVILDAGGNVLADGARASNCVRRASGACGGGPSPDYRLTGFPLAAVPVTAVLEQFTGKGKKVEADRAEFTLDPDGDTIAPDLTAVPDLPQGKMRGRTLFGQINYRAPFAPGARKAEDLDVPRDVAARLEVVLRAPGGKVRERVHRFTKSKLGYTQYEMTNLKACEGCTVALVDGRQTLTSEDVTVPEDATAPVRRDLNYAKAGDPEFLSGAILAGDAGARGLKVTVTDAASGELLTSTDGAGQACLAGLRCPSGQTMLYRLARVPPDRDVILTLERKGTPVDSQRVHTAGAGEITQAPPLVVPRGKGPRSIQGTTLDAGPFAPGGAASPPKKGTALVARLLGSDGAELTRGAAKAPGETAKSTSSYFLDDVPACTGCTLELLRPDGTVEDRVGVSVPVDSPSVTVADLRWRELSGGAYVQGQVVVRDGAVAPDDLIVQVQSTDGGKVLADSENVQGARNGSGRTARGRGPFPYRLGGIPAGTEKVKVVVLDRKRKRLASTVLTLAPGGADTSVPDLKVDVGRRKG